MPVRYSEGFNPHALISILLPLSVGTESLCQLADVRLRGDVDLAALPGTLNAVLPEGLRVQRCYENGAKPGELKWLRVKGTWEYGGGDMGRRGGSTGRAVPGYAGTGDAPHEERGRDAGSFRPPPGPDIFPKNGFRSGGSGDIRCRARD